MSYRLQGMRPMDMLPQLLAASNVHAGADVLLLESQHGFLAGALLERMGGEGRLWAAHFNIGRMAEHLLPLFNLSAKELAVRKLVDVSSLIQGGTGMEYMDSTDKRLVLIDEQLAELTAASALCEAGSAAAETLRRQREGLEKSRQGMLNKYGKKKAEGEKVAARHRYLREHGADSLVVASKYDVRTSTLALLPFLGIGKPVVAFSETVEPLNALRDDLRGKVVHVTVSSTWYREYQVLPDRTHPRMQMSGHGGYLLQAYKAEPNETAQDAVQYTRRKKAQTPEPSLKDDKDNSESSS